MTAAGTPRTAAAWTDRLAAASRAGDVAGAAAAFHGFAGLAQRRVFDALPEEAPDAPRVAMLRTGEPRRLDLAALLEGARPVVKFPRLTPEAAARLVSELVARGVAAQRLDAGADGTVAVVAARGGDPRAVLEAEADSSSEAARAAGLALGYPACCVEKYVEVQAQARVAGASVAEAAFRSIDGLREPWPWETNVLSSLSPLGFVPCRTTCGAATAFARRALGAVQKADPAGAKVVESVLQRPILFFRRELFYVLDGTPLTGPEAIVRYRRALANDDGRPADAWLRRWQAEELDAMLAEGDELALEGGALEIRRAGARVACWSVQPPGPVLLRFRPS
jgi:hypothetical protein